MILLINSDAVYLVEPKAKSRGSRFLYLGNKDGKLLNGLILILAKIIKFVMASAAKAEIAASILLIEHLICLFVSRKCAVRLNIQ